MLFQTTSTETSIQFEPFVHRFKPFEPKKGMSLAPVIRKQLSVETKRLLVEGLQHQVRGSCQNSSINQSTIFAADSGWECKISIKLFYSWLCCTVTHKSTNYWLQKCYCITSAVIRFIEDCMFWIRKTKLFLGNKKKISFALTAHIFTMSHFFWKRMLSTLSSNIWHNITSQWNQIQPL